MDLGNAQAGFLVALDLFDQFVGEKYKRGLIPHLVQEAALTLWLERPEMALREGPEGDLEMGLHLKGTYTWEAGSDDPEMKTLDLWARITPQLVAREGEAPTLEMAYLGLDGGGEDLFIEAAIDVKMRTELLGELQESTFDLLGPLIEAVAPSLYVDEEPPSSERWEAGLNFHRGGEGTVDALSLFIARPGESLPPAGQPSELPRLTEMAVVFSRSFLDEVMGRQAEEREGEEIDGAEITSLKMWMGDDAIQIDGEAEKEGAEIDFEGPMRLTMIVGTTYLVVDTSDVDVDVEKPWYYYLGIALAPFAFFIPVVNFFLINALVTKSMEAAAAPDTLRRGLSSSLAEALSQLAGGGGLSGGAAVAEPEDPDAITREGTPSHCRIAGGHLFLFAQVFVSPITEEMVFATYSKRRGRFLEYVLESGRRFGPSGLAKLVHSGKITVPGCHDVKGRYLRANPDKTERNNLIQRFAPSSVWS